MNMSASALRRSWNLKRLAVARAGLCLLAASAAVVLRVAPASAAPPAPPDYGAIDSYVAGGLAGTPGFAISIVHGDQVVHVKGFGVADSSGAPVTTDTPFVIGSESKSLTALGIMQLSESGALELDSPVQRYLPWIRVADAAHSQQITVRQLLNQTSGLPPSAPFDTPVTSVEQRVRDLAAVDLTKRPGREFQYSNSNYDILGLVIESISGQSYADYVNQHVFAPLGMTHSFASEAAAQQAGLATGHQWWFGVTVPVDTYRSDYVPAGYLVSSANDMSHYLVAQLEGGSYDGHRVLSEAGIAQMHTGVARVSTGGSYAMGWIQDTLNGTTVVSHDGDSLNMHSDMILVPALGWGVEVIANSDSVPVLLSASVESTAKGVVAMLMGSAAPFTLSPLGTYIGFDVMVLLLVAFQVWSLVRALRASVRPTRFGVASVLRQVVLPLSWRLSASLMGLGFLWLLAMQLGSSMLLIAVTDLGVSIIAFAALLAINGALRSARSLAEMRPANSAAAVHASRRNHQELEGGRL